MNDAFSAASFCQKFEIWAKLKNLFQTQAHLFSLDYFETFILLLVVLPVKLKD
jgi:hypothetical protein